MKEKQMLVNYLKGLTKQVEEAQCKVEAIAEWNHDFEYFPIDEIMWNPKPTDTNIKIDIKFRHGTPLEKPFEAKRGDFVVVNELMIFQMQEDLDDLRLVINEYFELVCVDEIREATESEKKAKIEDFKSRGLIEGKDGVWREPNLDEVYCVAKSKADLVRIYSVRPDLVSDGSSVDMNFPEIEFYDDTVWNDRGNDKIETSIEKFIELLKKA